MALSDTQLLTLAASTIMELQCRVATLELEAEDLRDKARLIDGLHGGKKLRPDPKLMRMAALVIKKRMAFRGPRLGDKLPRPEAATSSISPAISTSTGLAPA